MCMCGGGLNEFESYAAIIRRFGKARRNLREMSSCNRYAETRHTMDEDFCTEFIKKKHD